jgi:TrmH family RNA methyltransferase
MAGEFEVLKSKHNPLLKEIRAALRTGGLSHRGLLPIEGPTLLKEAFKSNVCVEALLIAESTVLDDLLLRRLEEQHTRICQVSREILSSVSDTESPAALIGLVKPPEWDFDRLFPSEQGLYLVVMGLQDPGNMGTIIRSAEAFRVTAILSTRKTVSAYNPKSVRATAGSIFRVPIFQEQDETHLFQLFKKHCISTLATSARARQSIEATPIHFPLALVIGQEAKGLSEDTIAACQNQVRIPTSDSVESLNAAIATGILLYEIRRHEEDL